MRTITKVVLVILGIGLLVAGTFPFIYGYAVLRWTDGQVRSKLNNPYIDNDYVGWKQVTMESGTRFRIPEDWKLTWEGTRFSLMSENGIVARGARIEKPREDDHNDRERFHEESYTEEIRLYPFPVVDYSAEELTTGNLGSGAQYYAITCTGENGEQETHYLLCFPYDRTYDYFFDFGILEGPQDPVLDYITAMAYSYECT